jgi:hypothetical protein
MANIERQIADEIAAANGVSVTKLGLRFDKVVVRLLGSLRGYVERANLEEKAILITITAPIKLAGKTQHELEAGILEFLGRKSHVKDRQMTIFKNKVRIRIVESSAKGKNRFVGLVHNPGTDSKMLLDLATKWLTASNN